jgi:oxalate decarboxylase/phosphoglucose isomerase-like protein (cupin superfamily)
MIIEGCVPRLESPTRAQFTERFMNPQTPVIISGATKHWKAHSAWTLDYLRLKIGRKQIRVKESATHLHPDLFSNIPSRYRESEFSEYIDLVASNSPERNKRYLSGDEIRILSDYTNVDPTFGLLRDDFETPGYFDREQIKTIGFWLSAQGVVASLHYDGDGCHNLNVQVKGKKRVLLFSPSQVLYPFSGLTSVGPQNFSQVNIVNPDEGRFPGFRSVRCLEAVIEEGDMLFIPSYWYHSVFHLGDFNINVNFWWPPDHFQLTKTSFRATFLGLLGSALAEGRPFANPSEIKDAIQNLSPDTKRLLQKMEILISQQYRI